MKRCKKAGSYSVCLFFSEENERFALTVKRSSTFSTEGEAYMFLFEDEGEAKGWYKGIYGVTDVEDLLRVVSSSDEIEQVDIDVE